MIKVHYWNAINNLGEQLVPIIVKWISGEETEWVPEDTKSKYLIIGSEMPRGVIQENDVVWGYGNRYNIDVIAPYNSTFLSVRGKHTRNHIKGIDVPEVYGDPGILISSIYQPQNIVKEFDIGLLTHHSDIPLLKQINDPKILLLDITENVYTLINKMLSCDVIICSSLHGCIVAESYGIPTIWILGNHSEENFEIKFNDYFSGTGREEKISPNILKEFSLSELNRISRNTLPIPIFEKEKLISAWKNQKSKI